MGLRADRIALAEALSGVRGVRNAGPHPPRAYTKGEAYPTLVRIDGDKFFTGVVTWSANIIVGTPTDPAAADDVLDDMVTSLRRQLRPLMTLTTLSIGVSSLVEQGGILVVQQQGQREFTEDDEPGGP